jgi:hypothetical protein
VASLDRARLFLTSLTGGERPEDEIFLMPFTDEIGPFQQLTSEQRSRPPMVATFGHSGSALYDALASALCHMRTVKNIRQAVVVITDGVDQNSRLRLDQLIGLVRSSSPQVFMVGLYSKPEYALFQQGHKTVPIVGQREIDNPVLVFKRLAKESGAESFFPSSEKDFKKALDHISALLKAEYTLAYYPPRVEEVRKIEVKVKRGGVKGSARHTVGSDNAVNTVHFIATACTVSPQQHPYPWESRVTSNSFSSMIYHEDFSDPRSGWPSHFNSGSGERYIRGGYELSRWVIPGNAHVQTSNGYIVDSGGTFVAAYGPWWNSFRAWSWVDTRSAGHNHAGMFFDVNESGYYALLLTPPVDGRVAFELVKGSWDGSQSVIVPRTSLAEFEQNTQHKLAVEVNRRQISLAVDNHHVGMIQNSTVEYGLVGFGLVGDSGGGRVIVSDLHVEAIP